MSFPESSLPRAPFSESKAESEKATLPHFIKPSVLERLSQGRFVAKRKDKPTLDVPFLGDRRSPLSPLALTKACLALDASVFQWFRQPLLDMGYALNHPEYKVLLLGSEQPEELTQLGRGLLELVGGDRQQVLWYRSGGGERWEQVLQFFMAWTCTLAQTLHTAASENSAVSSLLSPSDESANTYWSETDLSVLLEQFEASLEALAKAPLLVVLDQCQHWVNERNQLISPPIKRLLNVFLRYPNVKVLLLGTQLPYQDLVKLRQEQVFDYWVASAQPQELAQQWQQLQQASSRQEGLNVSGEWSRWKRWIEAEACPRWLLQWAFRLYESLATLNKTTQEALQEKLPPPYGPGKDVSTLLEGLWQVSLSLQPEGEAAALTRWLLVLGSNRIGLPLSQWQAQGERLFPALRQTPLVQQLPALEGLLQWATPPQYVLQQVQKCRLRDKEKDPSQWEPWFRLRHEARFLAEQSIFELSGPEQQRLHRTWIQFYQQQQQRLQLGEPIFSIDLLESETHYHQSRLQEGVSLLEASAFEAQQQSTSSPSLSPDISFEKENASTKQKTWVKPASGLKASHRLQNTLKEPDALRIPSSETEASEKPQNEADDSAMPKPSATKTFSKSLQIPAPPYVAAPHTHFERATPAGIITPLPEDLETLVSQAYQYQRNAQAPEAYQTWLTVLKASQGRVSVLQQSQWLVILGDLCAGPLKRAEHAQRYYQKAYECLERYPKKDEAFRP
jgi:hypothetical protein